MRTLLRWNWLAQQMIILKNCLTTFGRLLTSMLKTSREFLLLRPNQGCFTFPYIASQLPSQPASQPASHMVLLGMLQWLSIASFALYGKHLLQDSFTLRIRLAKHNAFKQSVPVAPVSNMCFANVRLRLVVTKLNSEICFHPGGVKYMNMINPST